MYLLWQWPGAFRQHAITWTNVDPVLRHRMSSQGHNELTTPFKQHLTNAKQIHWAMRIDKGVHVTC